MEGTIMKKCTVLVMAVFLAMGFAGTAGAVAMPTLTFEIDFYGGDTAYLQGEMDTGDTIVLDPCQWVWVDLYFHIGTEPLEAGLVGVGFEIPFGDSLEAADLSFPSPLMDTGMSEILPGLISGEAIVWPPGGTYGEPCTWVLFATFAFHCTGQGFDDIILYDPNPTTDQWVTGPNGLVLDEQLADGIYLASILNTPIPGAVWLLGSGMLGLMGLRRRMK
jgi:hypothetical protein